MIGVAVGPGPWSIGDAITAVLWSVVAALSVVLLWRRRMARRGAWLVVTFYCCVVAIDKWVDLQTRSLDLLRIFARVVELVLDAPPHDRKVKAGLLLALTALAIGLTAWLVRRDRPLDPDKRLAIAGLVLVLAWVGTRFLPGMAWLADERIGWTVEAVACVCIGRGLLRALRRRSGTEAATPSVR